MTSLLLINYMPKKILLTILILTVSIVSASISAQDKLCQRTILLSTMLEKYHVSPPVKDDSFSREVFMSLINSLDPECMIFSQADFNSFLPFRYCLRGTQNSDSVCWLVKKLSDLYLKKLLLTDSLFRSCLANPMDFMTPDSVEAIATDDLRFAAGEKERINRWGRMLKFWELEILFGEPGSDSLLIMGAEGFAAKEKEARRRLEIKQRRILSRLLDHPQGMEEYVTGKLFKAFCNRFDPHSEYFNGAEIRNFMTMVSRQAKIFGLYFGNNKNGEAEISYLTPGGAAWKSGLVHMGDGLNCVIWPDGKKVDLTFADGAEADKIINDSEYESMELTVRQANGNNITVHLNRQLIDVEDNNVSGYILKGKRIFGYISLPGFYGGTSNIGSGGVSSDVAREIHLLEKSGIEGLIIDLRNNGGGSENEARDLIGLFIDDGPLFILQEKGGKPYLVKDMNRGVGYSGPLLVMVNGLSASASELTAACLQDYHRALIVGSPTFGKGVGQVVLPLDTNETSGKASKMNNRTGFIKVTTHRIYRLAGASFQKAGVIPDILVPEPNFMLKYREENEKWALEPDRTDKKVIFNSLPPLPIDTLRKKAGERMKPGNPLRDLKDLCDSAVTASKNENSLDLRLAFFDAFEARRTLLESRLQKLLDKSSSVYSVLEGMADTYSGSLSSRKDISSARIRRIQNDIFIEEAFHVLNDLIGTQISKL